MVRELIKLLNNFPGNFITLANTSHLRIKCFHVEKAFLNKSGNLKRKRKIFCCNLDLFHFESSNFLKFQNLIVLNSSFEGKHL